MESRGATGISGSAGWAATVMKPASAMRTRMGTLRRLKMGRALNTASTRMNGHTSGASQALSCASVKVITGRVSGSASAAR